jgi:hypothetical protein
MTVGFARRFGDRILIVSDTMISNESAARNDFIPGKVKAIVLCEDVSVAYAGSVGHAVVAIRKAADVARNGGRIEDIIEPLKATSAETTGTAYETEFLVASHRGEILMLKVWKNGEIAKNDDRLWIGQPEVVNAIDDMESRIPPPEVNSLPDWISPAELRFSSAVAQVATQPTQFSRQGVGGFLVTLLASPIGHGYYGGTGAAFWDIDIGAPAAEKQTDQSSGMNYYIYHILAGFWRGAPVLAAYLEQPKVGYLYHPLRSEPEDVKKFEKTTPEELYGRISESATAMGAVIRN